MKTKKSIGITTDYSKFKMLNGYNRPVDEKHVKELMASIQSNNMTEYFPIVVNEQFEVIDGQHRLKAIERLGLDVYYIVSNNLDYSGIKLVNNNQKNWNIKDYLESEIRLGNVNYIAFKEYCNKHKMPYNLMLSVLTETSSTNMSLNKKFKKGVFVMPNTEKAETFFKYLYQFKDFTGFDITANNYFIRSCIKLFQKENYEQKRMIRKLEIFPKMIKRCSSIDDYFQLFNEIYNFRVKKQSDLVYLK